MQDPAVDVFASLCRRVGRPVPPHVVEDVLVRAPSFPSLLAVSDALDAVGIAHDAVEVDPAALAQLPLPHLAFLRAGAFAVVTERSDDSVVIDGGRGVARVPRDEYLAAWSGATLVPSGELRDVTFAPPPPARGVPDALLGGAALGCLAAIVSLAPPASFAGAALIAVVLLGLGCSCLLAAEELGVSTIAARLCNAGRTTSCRGVLASRAARLGPVSMADVGVCFFSSSLMLLLAASLHPSGPAFARSLLALASLAALPYTVFSIVYQGFRLRLWCPLCVVVQLTLWAMAALSWPTTIVLAGPFALVALAALPALSWLAVKPRLHAAGRLVETERALARLEGDADVASALLGRSEAEALPPAVIELAAGRDDAPLTVVLYVDPTCGFCGGRFRAALEAERAAAGALRVLVRVYGPMSPTPRALALVRVLADRLAAGDPAAALDLYRRWYDDTLEDAQLVATDAGAALLASHEQLMRERPQYTVPMLFVGDRRWPDHLSLRGVVRLAQAAARSET